MNRDVVVALGGNLPHPLHGSSVETCLAALAAMERQGLAIAARSRFFETEPMPPSDQPRFANAVVRVETPLAPREVMTILHGIEDAFGRRRQVRNEARVLDLDLIAFDGLVSAPGEWPEVPHPRMHLRGFVLVPLCDILPDWRHPVTGRTVEEMIAALPRPLGVVPLA